MLLARPGDPVRRHRRIHCAPGGALPCASAPSGGSDRSVVTRISRTGSQALTMHLRFRGGLVNGWRRYRRCRSVPSPAERGRVFRKGPAKGRIKQTMKRPQGSPDAASLSTERLFERRARALGAHRSASRVLRAGEDSWGHFPVYGSGIFDPHVAGRHEFVFAVSGRARIATPRDYFSIEPGGLLLIEPGVDHGEAPAESPSSYVLCWCVLDQSYAMLLHTTYSAGSNWTLGGPQLELPGRTNVQSIAVAIGAELAHHAWGWQVAVQSLLRYLSCILVRRIRRGRGHQLAPLESPTVANDPAAWEVVQNALQHCRANFHLRLRVEDVANAVGYSSSRLSHLFSAYIGQSVADHVRSLRMARARDLLEVTDLTVSEVARRVGYGDPAHFSRAFKRSERVSPNAFRERLRGH